MYVCIVILEDPGTMARNFNNNSQVAFSVDLTINVQ